MPQVARRSAAAFAAPYFAKGRCVRAANSLPYTGQRAAVVHQVSPTTIWRAKRPAISACAGNRLEQPNSPGRPRKPQQIDSSSKHRLRPVQLYSAGRRCRLRKGRRSARYVRLRRRRFAIRRRSWSRPVSTSTRSARGHGRQHSARPACSLAARAGRWRIGKPPRTLQRAACAADYFTTPAAPGCCWCAKRIRDVGLPALLKSRKRGPRGLGIQRLRRAPHA